MLRSITIKNYRCFESFQVDELAPINLIAGANNSGKTSLLEAVYLVVNQLNPASLFDVMSHRREIVDRPGFSDVTAETPRVWPLTKEMAIKPLFFGHHLDYNQKISIASQSTTIESPLLFHISIRPAQNQISVRPNWDKHHINMDMIVDYGTDGNAAVGQWSTPVIDDGYIFAQLVSQFPITDSSGSENKAFFLTPRRPDFYEIASQLWPKITLTDKEAIVLESLQIIEPDVQGINFTINTRFNSHGLVKLRGQKEPIHLGSMGGGIGQILNLMCAAVTVENGVLLVDEIDTGLHYEVQADMWRLLIKISQKLNLQIFATTHSYDCIAAFSEALDASGDSSQGKLFRLDWRGKLGRAIEYPAAHLAIAVNQDIEVR